MIPETQLKQLAIEWFQDTRWNYVEDANLTLDGLSSELIDFRTVVLKSRSFDEPTTPGKGTWLQNPWRVGRVPSHGVRDRLVHRCQPASLPYMFNPKGNETMNGQNQFLLYTTPNEAVKVEVFLKDEIVWLTQKSLAELFGVQMPAINKHLKNIFDSGELVRDASISKVEIVRDEGNSAPTRSEISVCSISEHTCGDFSHFPFGNNWRQVLMYPMPLSSVASIWKSNTSK